MIRNFISLLAVLSGSLLANDADSTQESALNSLFNSNRSVREKTLKDLRASQKAVALLPRLIEKMADDNWATRYRAVEALSCFDHVGDNVITALTELASIQVPKEDDIDSSGGLSSLTIDELGPNAKKRPVKILALQTLVRLSPQSEQSLELVIRASDDQEKKMREVGIKLLNKIPTSVLVLGKLESLFDDTDRGIKRLAVDALLMHSKRIKTLKNADESVVRSLIHALSTAITYDQNDTATKAELENLKAEMQQNDR